MTWIWSPSPFVEGPAAMYVHWRPVFLQHLAAAWSASIKLNKTCIKWPLKKTKNWFTNRLLLNTDQNYFRMLQGDYSAILLILIELPFTIKTFLSILSGRLRQVLLCFIFTNYHTHAFIYHITSTWFWLFTSSPLYLIKWFRGTYLKFSIREVDSKKFTFTLTFE